MAWRSGPCSSKKGCPTALKVRAQGSAGLSSGADSLSSRTATRGASVCQVFLKPVLISTRAPMATCVQRLAECGSGNSTSTSWTPNSHCHWPSSPGLQRFGAESPVDDHSFAAGGRQLPDSAAAQLDGLALCGRGRRCVVMLHRIKPDSRGVRGARSRSQRPGAAVICQLYSRLATSYRSTFSRPVSSMAPSM